MIDDDTVIYAGKLPAAFGGGFNRELVLIGLSDEFVSWLWYISFHFILLKSDFSHVLFCTCMHWFFKNENESLTS